MMSACIKTSSYLETLVSFLTTSNILAWLGNSDDWDVVIVTAKEVLSASDDVTHNDSSTEWIENVLVVRMQDQTFRYFAWA